MRIVVILGAVLVVVIAIVLVVGWSLPVAHRATRSIALRASPEAVFNLISRPADFPSWRSDVTRVELLPPDGGRAQFREVGKNGAIVFAVDSMIPPRRIVTRIADKSLPFGGSWTYDVEPGGGTTTLTITEDGEVYNPVFRFVSRFVMGQTATIDRYLADVRKRLE
jgi:uncharacterized protein YndB with AHSA1/START domain